MKLNGFWQAAEIQTYSILTLIASFFILSMNDCLFLLKSSDAEAVAPHQEGMDMGLSRTQRVFMGAIRILGRALLGALAGLIVVSLTLIIATDYFYLFAFENSVAGDRSFWKVVSLGSLTFALIAMMAGETKIRGRAGDTIKGVLTGALVGVMIGPALSFVAGENNVLQKKSGAALGIFLGGPIGAILGGILGVNQNSSGRRRKELGMPDVGTRDQI